MLWNLLPCESIIAGLTTYRVFWQDVAFPVSLNQLQLNRSALLMSDIDKFIPIIVVY